VVSIKEVLSRVRKGTTVAALSKELDMREATLRAMLEFMVEKDYLEELKVGGSCAGCSLKMKCNVPESGKQRVKMYVLTKEGIEYIKENNESKEAVTIRK
jgi:DNA-binding MarR family transcriptional regulator